MLVGLGGLVTSKGVGMAVPDWPTSYGYNMFLLPIATWRTGGIFDEHTHRLWASIVGVLVVALTRWLGGRSACKPLILCGVVEIVAGLLLLRLGSDWSGAGHFLIGIGGVVLLAGLVRVNNPRSSGSLPLLGWTAFGLVQLQGLLGGLRVVLDAHVLADVRMGTAFGVLHGILGQVFLVVLAIIALRLSRRWVESVRPEPGRPSSNGMEWLLAGVTLLILIQLLLGAAMRHQHAGLAVPDFPLAHGQLYPSTAADSIASYNAQRLDARDFNPITPFQIHLHMAHRMVALSLLALVPWAAWRFRAATRSLAVPGRRLAGWWMALVVAQAALGIVTVLRNKPADVATAHVMIGALCLAFGAMLSLIAREFSIATENPVMQARAHSQTQPAPRFQS